MPLIKLDRLWQTFEATASESKFLAVNPNLQTKSCLYKQSQNYYDKKTYETHPGIGIAYTFETPRST